MTKKNLMEINNLLHKLAQESRVYYNKVKTLREKAFWEGRECGIMTALAYIHGLKEWEDDES